MADTMTKDDLLSDFLACVEQVAASPTPEDAVGQIWHRLCVQAASRFCIAHAFYETLNCGCLCCDTWDYLWPDEREQFQAENHILWQAVESLGHE
jgi:hypothetical protein